MFAVYFCLLQVLFFEIAKGENCQTPVGTWFDEYGSQLTLDVSGNGILSGNYTPVSGNEFGIANASNRMLTLIGKAEFNKSNVAFGFSIQVNNGDAVKSWTGQCLMCSGQETLQITWLLRKRVGYSDGYLSTYIGLAVFTRTKPTSNGGYPTGKGIGSIRGKRAVGTGDPSTRQNCSLNGTWYNDLGSEMNLTLHENMTLTGQYRTAVERAPGSAGPTKMSPVFGLAVPGQPDGTFAWNVIWSNGTSITGFVGQCHLIGADQSETLLTAWVLRVRIASCDDTWKSTYFGENVFTRYEQINVTQPKATTLAASTDHHVSGVEVSVSAGMFPVLLGTLAYSITMNMG